LRVARRRETRYATPMIVLGIETSCDETAAAVVDERGLRAQALASQIALHGPHGGIVPELAARAHLDHLDGLIARAMADAKLGFRDLDAVAATAGPGLIGGVIVGVMTGKAIALAHDLPFLAINHLEGHALSPRLVGEVAFPYLLLLVTGGHCQLLIVEGVGAYVELGTTVDDAVGEAFDKAAKLLGLGYPGGPEIERLAARGEATRIALPRPMAGRPGCDFSFAGLKTALRLAAEKHGADSRADLAASFQAAVGDVLADRTVHAIAAFKQRHPEGRTLVVAGGVAANQALRKRLGALAERHGLALVAPPRELCTDNAAMIAWAGLERRRLGQRDGLDFAPTPRWPLDPAKRRA
jgi:N6-L-threonylcarbamoyladenine synthase